MTKIEERMLECAEALKGYCEGLGGYCKGCLFDTDNDCVLSSLPEDWNLEDCSKTEAIESLKEMRENIKLDGNEAEKKVIALNMAIEVLEG